MGYHIIDNSWFKYNLVRKLELTWSLVILSFLLWNLSRMSFLRYICLVFSEFISWSCSFFLLQERNSWKHLFHFSIYSSCSICSLLFFHACLSSLKLEGDRKWRQRISREQLFAPFKQNTILLHDPLFLNEWKPSCSPSNRQSEFGVAVERTLCRLHRPMKPLTNSVINPRQRPTQPTKIFMSICYLHSQ